jgi:hypothetical protein
MFPLLLWEPTPRNATVRLRVHHSSRSNEWREQFVTVAVSAGVAGP